MPVRVDVNRVHMHEADAAAPRFVVVAPELQQSNIKIIPRPPLEDQITLRGKFLQHGFIHSCIGSAARVEPSHIHGLSAYTEE